MTVHRKDVSTKGSPLPWQQLGSQQCCLGLSHPALAGALGVCWDGFIGAFLMSEMEKSWVGRIA